MTGTRFVLVAVLVVAALALSGCGGGNDNEAATTTETTTTTAPAGTTLEGNVGPGFEISLTQNGQSVTTLAPGSYTLEVNDQSDIHNFHLTGPGVDVSTDVSETGMKTFDIELQDGSYHYQCDPHSSSLNGDFEVTG